MNGNENVIFFSDRTNGIQCTYLNTTVPTMRTKMNQVNAVFKDFCFSVASTPSPFLYQRVRTASRVNKTMMKAAKMMLTTGMMD